MTVAGKLLLKRLGNCSREGQLYLRVKGGSIRGSTGGRLGRREEAGGKPLGLANE